MSEVDQAKFSCDGCGKTYKWKPEFAGRKVKCKCGFVMTAPDAPPAPPDDEPDLDALYTLADEGKQAVKSGAVDVAIRCPSCRSQLEPGATICAQCGFNLKTGKKGAPAAAAVVPERGPAGGGAAAAVAGKQGGAPSAFQAFAGTTKKRIDPAEPARDFTAIDLYLPIGLLIGGIALMTLQFMHFYPTTEPLTQALLYTGLWLVISFALVCFGSVFLIRFMEMAFGDPLQAALKIAGIVIAPAAIANIISFLIHDAPPTGWGLVGFFLAFGMFFILYHYLFEFDMSEMWLIVGLTTVMCMMATPFAFKMIVATNPGSLASKGAKNEDAQIEYMMDMGRPQKLREWLDGSANRVVGDIPRGYTEELYKGVMDAGAQEMWCVVDGPQAAEVYIKMPKDSKKRKAVIDAISAWNVRFKRSPDTDEGGKWHAMTFLPYSRPEPVGF